MLVNLFVELIGSFVGAGLGLFIALWYDRRKERKETEQRRQLAVSTLIEEIERTVLAVDVKGLEAVDTPEPHEPFEIDLSYPYLLDAAFTGTIYSGGLALLPSDLQTDLSQYYRQLDLANALVKRLVTLAPELDASNLQLYRNISTHLTGSTAMLKQQGEELLVILRHLTNRKDAGK